MRQYVEAELIKEGTPCQCIRCREVKAGEYDVVPELINRELNTYGGIEHLLTFEKDQKLYSLLRLRLPNLEPLSFPLFPELEGCAIIREIHTYGKTLSHEDKLTQKTQHQGLGKKLMQEAENIARAAGYKKMAVISSIGTREYYRALGYERSGYYMVKPL